MNEAPTNKNVINNDLNHQPITTEPAPQNNAASMHPEGDPLRVPGGIYPYANGAENSPHSALRTPLSGIPLSGVSYAAPGPAPKTAFPVERKDYLFAGGFLLLCVAVVAMGLFGAFNLGFTVSYGALFLALSAYLKRPGVYPGAFGCVCGALALATTSVFFLCANIELKLFACASIICLSSVWFYTLSGRKEEKGDLGLLKNLAEHTAVSTVLHFGESWRGLLFSGDRKTVGKALVGVLCALPVAIVAVALLVKADGAFEALTLSLLDRSFLLILKIGMGLFAGVFVIAFALAMKKTDPEARRDPVPGKLDAVYAAAFTAVLCLCYCFYLFSQLAYFFDAFRGLIPAEYDFSFSDYARQGFFELCWIAGINFVVVFAVLLLAKPKNGRLHPVLKGTCTFICLFTLLVIATAVAKMVMYIREYGMTELRVGTGAFMCFIVAVFVALTLRLYLPKVRVLRVALIGAACTVLLLGAGNYDGFIAAYNDKTIYADDPGLSAADELNDLGPAGVPYLVKLADNADPKVAERADEALRDLRYEYYDYEYDFDSFDKDAVVEPEFRYDVKTQGGFNHYNIPVAAAYKALDAYFADGKPLRDAVADSMTEPTAAPETKNEMTTEPTAAPEISTEGATQP